MILLTLILALRACVRLLAQGLALRATSGAVNLTCPDAPDHAPSKPTRFQAHETPPPKPVAIDRPSTRGDPFGPATENQVAARTATPVGGETETMIAADAQPLDRLLIMHPGIVDHERIRV